MRLTAFFKLYKMCTLLHRSKLNILAKNRFRKSVIFVKFQLGRRRGAGPPAQGLRRHGGPGTAERNDQIGWSFVFFRKNETNEKESDEMIPRSTVNELDEIRVCFFTEFRYLMVLA